MVLTHFQQFMDGFRACQQLPGLLTFCGVGIVLRGGEDVKSFHIAGMPAKQLLDL